MSVIGNVAAFSFYSYLQILAKWDKAAIEQKEAMLHQSEIVPMSVAQGTSRAEKLKGGGPHGSPPSAAAVALRGAMMAVLIALPFCLHAVASTQQAGSQEQEEHVPLSIATCNKAGGCKDTHTTLTTEAQ